MKSTALLLSLISPAAAQLAVSSTSADLTWADHGSGSDYDISCYDLTVKVDLFSKLGHYCQGDYLDAGTGTNWQVPYGPPFLVADLSDALAEPTGWVHLYSVDFATTTADFWRPMAPDGYRALGDFVTTTGAAPEDETIRVVSESCTVPCDNDVHLWTSTDGDLLVYGQSGADNDEAYSLGLARTFNTSAEVEAGTYCLAASCVTDSATIPEQIHLALGASPDYMAVQWATMDSSPFCTTRSDVQYGLSEDALDKAASGDCFQFDVGVAQVDPADSCHA